jgi:hypothetical protein
LPWHLLPLPRKNQHVTISRTLYIRREKGNTPPFSIAGEKYIAMKNGNLLLREKLAKASQTLNEEVSNGQDRAYQA